LTLAGKKLFKTLLDFFGPRLALAIAQDNALLANNANLNI
jgi:hypothetical protein